MKKIIIITSLLLILTGCCNHQELNNIAVVSGIDIEKEKNNYHITMQIINTSNKNKNNKEFIIYEGNGSTLNTAIESTINKVPQKLYETQIQVLTIDENIAKTNLKEIIEYFIRNNDTRNEFYILISKRNKNSLSLIKKFPSKKIVNTLKSSNKYTGISPLITLNNLIDTYENKNIEIILPIADSIQENSTEIIINSSGVFKNNKLIGTLNKEDTIIYNLITNKVKNTLITTKCNNSKYIINKLIKPKTTLKLKNNKIKITITGTSIIKENNCKQKLNNTDNIKKIEKKINSNIQKQIKTSITKTNLKYTSDIYGFKNYIYKHHQKYYKKKIKKDNNYLNKLKISIKSNIKIIKNNNLLGDADNE